MRSSCRSLDLNCTVHTLIIIENKIDTKLRAMKSYLAIISQFLIHLNVGIGIASPLNCLTYATSTCPNNVVTAWNKKDIGKSLALWIRSVHIDKIDQDTATYWNNQVYPYRGKHCKTITIKRNEYFANMVPYMFTPHITILGKVAHDDDGKDFQPKTRKFLGPIWASMNDKEGELYKNNIGDIFGYSKDAELRNGLYYGILNNEKMTLGMHIILHLKRTVTHMNNEF